MTTEEFSAKLAQAQAGDKNAQNAIGYAYSNGDGVEKNLEKAFEWFLKSAEQGQLNSIMNVGGWCYLWGNGTTQDNEKALYWMEKAIALGAKDDWSLNAHATALNNYGWDLYTGKKNGSSFGAVKDVDKAAELFQKAADTGRCVFAITNLGNCYQTGQGVAKDLHKAKELYDKAFAAGQQHNDVVDRWLKELDEELAKEASASIGSFSMDNSGSAFSGISVVPAFERQRLEEEARKKAEEEARRKAEEEAPRREFERLLALAEQGDAKAQCDVANAYVNELGVEKDLKKAFEWYLKSARQGNTCAMANVGGFCYFYGNGTDENNELAVYWLKKAWEAGYQNDWSKDKYGRALYWRANDYAILEGQARDKFHELAEKCRQSSILDESKKLLQSCEDCAAQIKDYEAKCFTLRLEAAKYTPIAYQKLAQAYRYGWGVDKDLFKAKEWADKAFEAGECDKLEGDWIMSLEKELEEHKEELAEKRRQEEAQKRREAVEAREAEEKAKEAQGRKNERYLNGMGVFSIAPNRKVAFSAGTLLYNTSTQEWSFAESHNPSDIDDCDDVISAFAFGTGKSIDPTEYDEDNGFNDWGENAIVNGGNKAGLWRTLEVEEWKYLINERPHAKDLWRIVTLEETDIELLMLVPDNLKSQEFTGAKKGEISEDDLMRLEELGVVFLYMHNIETCDEFKYWLKWGTDEDDIVSSVAEYPFDYYEYVDPDELHPVRLVRDL